MDITKQLMSPAGNFFRYKNAEEMKAFQEKLQQEARAKWKLPITLEQISTKPEINVFVTVIDEGAFPLVAYSSAIDLKDTVALKVENEKVKKEIGLLFKGIDRNKKYVFYRVFHGIPGDTGLSEYYGFADKLQQ